jgi:2-iminobutanoate/2-iminopropanoate deaminase
LEAAVAVSERRRAIQTEGAPAPVGPYSQGIVAASLLFCAGQVPLDPNTGELVEGGVVEQAERCLANLEAVCEAAGTSLANAVRVTVFTTELDEMPAVNEVYGGFFPSPPPARVGVGVSALPAGAAIEIEAIVSLPATG